MFGTIPTTIPDTTPVITPPATQTDTPVIPTETPIIAPTIPPSPDYTPASPDYSPASDSESDPSEDPSSDHIPPLPAISPFLSSDDDTTDSDTLDTPPSPTHASVGHPVDHSSSDYFSPDDSARDSSSNSSSEASSDFHSDASSDSSSGHSLLDHSSPDLPSTSAGPSRKRRRSPMKSVPALSPVSRALSPVCADLIPSPKRVKDSGYLADVEVDPREISLRDDAIVRVSDEPHLEQDIDPEIHAEIDECIAYAYALRDRGIDARVVVEAADRDETETGMRGRVQVRVERVMHPAMPKDIPEPAQEGAVEGHRIVGVESAVTALTERVAELERDNRRLLARSILLFLVLYSFSTKPRRRRRRVDGVVHFEPWSCRHLWPSLAPSWAPNGAPLFEWVPSPTPTIDMVSSPSLAPEGSHPFPVPAPKGPRAPSPAPNPSVKPGPFPELSTKPLPDVDLAHRKRLKSQRIPPPRENSKEAKLIMYS
ncbi:hypothetical protein Tco_0217298 [Tanacetum coccineum]